MKNSILTKFFTGYFSFAILGFLLISYWSNNLIYNHLLTNNINTLYKYASVIGSNAVDCVDNSLDDLDNPKQFLNDFNNVLDCDILILDSNRKPFYYTGTTSNLSKDSSNILIEKFKPDDYKNTHYKIGKFYNIFKIFLIVFLLIFFNIFIVSLNYFCYLSLLSVSLCIAFF